MPEWTPAQRRAIESNSRKIICSAAAGSGKTAVMVERIVRFLREGASPDQFLVVTFTNAAAGEMKEKIKKRLFQEAELPQIRLALDQLDLMQISTIHSFCQQLIRNQFQLAEIDPSFQICDSSQRKILFHEAFREACNELQEENDPSFLLLKSRYSVQKAEKELAALEVFLLSMPDPLGWMNGMIEGIPEKRDPEHPWFAALRDMARDELRSAEITLARMYRMFSDSFAVTAYQESWKADAELFHVKQSCAADPGTAGAPSRFASLRPVRGLNPQEMDWKERYQNLRKKYKESLQRADELLLADMDQTLAEWRNMKETLRAFRVLLERTENLFQTRKKARSLADFQDLEQYAVRILSDPMGREEAQSTWRYVFVDECQDISAVQNYMIDLLMHPDNHLFMVGDIKQSIYRFRLADPLLFQERMRSCREDPLEGECIYLQSNFRSVPAILETTNRVFRSVMKASVTEIDYGPEEELVPERTAQEPVPVQCVVLQKGKEDQSDLEAAALFIRDTVEDLLRTPYPGQNRNYEYRDCVILMPAVQQDGPVLSRLLEEMDLPVFFDGGEDYYQLREIQVIRNLLSWIDDPLSDLPLISVLRETPFSLTEEELGLIRLKKPEKDVPFHEAFRLTAEEDGSPLGEKCRRALRKLKEWQDWAEIMRVGALIWELYRDTGIYYILGADPAGEAKQANLRMLAQQASEAESRGVFTLRQFLAYMKDQQAAGDKQSATLLGEQDNLVRIMTVHKSKGLQFPVVFCAGMDRSAAGRDTEEIRCHPRLGLCADYKDPEHRISRKTLAADLFAWKKKREEIAEKVRLLYVAMTRAQERLYLMTCQETNPLWSMPESEGRILSAKSFTDWWMPALLQESGGILSTGYAQSANPYEIRLFECNQQKTVEKDGDFHSLASWLKSVISAPVVDELWKKPEEKEKSPTLKKRSVTSLIREARHTAGPEPEEEEETAEGKRLPDQLKERLFRTEMPEAPEFLRQQGQISAAWRGTLTHRVLSLISLERLREVQDPAEALREEKEHMLREHIASAAELDAIRDQQIVSFWQSETGRRILNSPEVHREWNFNLLIRREEQMILQGVIDCAFREGDGWVILDYKTDRGKTAEELAEEYRPQLQWYARAVEELTGLPVREAALYSLDLDEVIPVPVKAER